MAYLNVYFLWRSIVKYWDEINMVDIIVTN